MSSRFWLLSVVAAVWHTESMRISIIVPRLGVGMVVVLTIMISVSLFSTSPDQLGPFVLTLWFLALFVAISGAVTAALYSYKRIIHKKSGGAMRESLRQGVLSGIWLTSLLALSSLRQLSLRDVVLLAVLLILIEFYMRRSR